MKKLKKLGQICVVALITVGLTYMAVYFFTANYTKEQIDFMNSRYIPANANCLR